MENALTMDQPSLTPAYPGASGTSLPGAVRLLTLAEVSPADRHAWHDLGTDAADKNAFADPELVIAGLTHVSSGDVRLAFVNARGGQLIGVAPLVIATQLGRFPLRHIRLWDHPNSFCTAVLIREGHGHAFWSILFAALAADPGWARSCAVALPMLPYDSQAFESLSRVAAARNWALTIVEDHARALANGTESLDGYWDTHVRAKKRKEIRRQSARLAELGTVVVDELTDSDDIIPWITEFLTLEHSGWKGAAGSALAAAPGTDGYFRAVVTAAHTSGRLCFVALRLDGRAIAMLVTLLAGEAAFSFKTAYDEALARFSPGVLIQRDNLPILARRHVAWADSCAAPDHPMIDSLWAERRMLGTVVVALPGWRNQITVNMYRSALYGWRQLKRLRRSAGDHQ